MLRLSQQSQMIALYRHIESLIDRPQGKLILLLSGHPGEGVSTIAAGLAEFCGDVLGRSVLVMEIKHGWAMQPAVDATGSRWQDFQAPETETNREAFSSNIAQYRLGYEYVILVSPALSVTTTGLEMAQHADGVVLVIEAESSRWKSSRRICEEIVGSGGNLLGVVLNKRRRHIPSWLASFL